MTYQHEIKVRVYYQDTDAGGIVYHANYLRFAERGRTEYSRSLGDSAARVLGKLKISTVGRHVDIDYLAPAQIDDELRIVTYVGEIKNTSYSMHSDIYIGEKLINRVKMTLVAVNESWKPVKIPEEMKALLAHNY